MQTSDLSVEMDALHPLEVVEHVMTAREWTFERRGDDEVVVEMPGRWCEYGLFFALSAELETMHISCALDLRVPENRRGAVNDLLALANEKLWMGHFSLWLEEGLPMFRYSLMLGDDFQLGPDRLRAMIDLALTECERFYPAFQYVVWGGKTADDAMEAAMLETVGEA